jgi:hypothetical protein
MSYPMPTINNLERARQEFLALEPRDFFYWSVTKLVDATFADGDVDELVRALMMLLTTWNKNYYRFFKRRKPGMTLQEHFTELETAIRHHRLSIEQYRKRNIGSLEDGESDLLKEYSVILKMFLDEWARRNAYIFSRQNFFLFGTQR